MSTRQWYEARPVSVEELKALRNQQWAEMQAKYAELFAESERDRAAYMRERAAREGQPERKMAANE